MQWRPSENWFISGNLATLDATVRRVHVQGRRHRRSAGNDQRPGLVRNAERRIPAASASGGQLSYRIGYSYQSDVVATTEITKDPITNAVTVPITQDGYGLLSAGIIWNTANSWTLSLQGSNLADEEYLTTGYVIPSTGVRTGFYGAPQVVSLSARFDF